MSLKIRRTTFPDLPAARRLGAEAFGAPRSPQPAPAAENWPAPNTRPWVVADDGEVVAGLAVRRFTSWFHGALVPTAGVAGVSVVAERRGAGLLRPLFDAVLAEAREHGEIVSTLYPTASGIYRGLGYETVGSFDEVQIPMSALAAVRRPGPGIRTRRATAADVPAVREVYSAWASGQNGPLARTESPFIMEPEEMVGPDSELTGVSLAVSGGPAGSTDERVLGFVSWTRGHGYDRSGSIEVDDLMALTPDAARALWRLLGTFSGVVAHVRVSTSGWWTGADVTRLVLPDDAATTRPRPYMLRLLDVPGALGTAHLPPVSGRVPFAVADPRTPDLEGAWTLVVDAGRVHVVPDDPHTDGPGADEPGADQPGRRPTFTSAGIALSYSGAQSTANLRLAGLLTGTTTHDALWDALWGGRQVHVRDYF